MDTWWFHEFSLVFIAHRNNYLLSWWTFHCHVNFWFWLTVIVDNFMNIFNFLCLKIWEDFFDLQNFLDTWAYDFLLFLMSFSRLGWLFFLKNLGISLTSLGVFARIGGGSLMKLAGLSAGLSFLDLFLTSWILGVNFDVTFCQKEQLSLSETSESYPES